MEDKKLTNEESLALIAEVINNTRRSLSRNAGLPLIIWGWTTVAVASAVTIALHATGDNAWNYMWFAIPVIGALLRLATRKKQAAEANTQLSRSIGYIWLVLAFAMVSYSVAAFLAPMPILGIIALLMGAGSAATGILTRWNVLVFCGILDIVLGIACLLLPQVQLYIFIALFAFTVALPGHWLNRKTAKNV